MMSFLLLLFLSFEAVSGQYKSYCPRKETIRPCSCSISKDRRPWITCSGLSSVDELQRSTKYMKGYSFTNVFIENSNLGGLPSNLFSDMEITSLKIFFTNLTSLGDGANRPPFVGLENSLEDLQIKDAFVDDTSPLNSLNVAHLKKLSVLEIINNVVPFIPNDWFESGPYGLKQLSFETSSTKKLGSHAFANLVNLKQIAVTGGRISELSRSMFPTPAHHLTSIDLSNNALASLPASIFHEMPSLREVYLDSNGFTEINEVVFSPVWNQLTHVYLFGNPVNCDDNIKWVYKYRLPEVLGGSCAQPERLRQKDLRKLTLKDLE